MTRVPSPSGGSSNLTIEDDEFTPREIAEFEAILREMKAHPEESTRATAYPDGHIEVILPNGDHEPL
jgi:hypothetical protein